MKFKTMVDATEQVTSYKKELYTTSTAPKWNRLLERLIYLTIIQSVQTYTIICSENSRMLCVWLSQVILKYQIALNLGPGLTIESYFEMNFVMA